MQAAFSNAGQMCIGIERIYVHEKVFDSFRDELVKTDRATAAGSRMRLRRGRGFAYLAKGSWTSPCTMSGRMPGSDKGASVATGGRPRPDLGPFFHEPTVLTGVTAEMAVYAEETFESGGHPVPGDHGGGGDPPR